MELELISYNGNVFSSNYYGFVVYPKPLRLGADAQFLEVAGTFAQYTGKSFGGGYLTIQVRYEDAFENQYIREDEIKRWFTSLDESPYMLLAKDTADLVVPDRQWYCMGTPISITPEGNSAVIVLALESPYWQVYTPSTS